MRRQTTRRWIEQLKPLKRQMWALLLIGSCWLAMVAGSLPAGAAHPAAALPGRDPTAITWQQALSEGLTAYHRGQFSVAIAHWQAALSAATGDRLPARAYLLNNLAVAYERLGQPSAARAALAESAAIVRSWPERDLAYWEIAARVSNSQGQQLWRQGQAQQALAMWKQAELQYREAAARSAVAGEEQPSWQSGPTASAPSSGLISSQINQALALQELGFNAEAVRQLTALRQAIATLPPRLRWAATRELGKALRRVGELAAAQSVLSSELAQDLAPEDANLSYSAWPVARQQLALELAHALRQRSHRAMAIGKVSQAQTYAEAALGQYAAAIAAFPGGNATAEIALLRAQAQLNQLSYLIEMGQLDEARAIWPEVDLADLPVGRARTAAYISYAHSLACLQVPAAVACTRQEWQAISTRSPAGATREQLWAPLGEALAAAIGQARAAADPLLESYALGELGHAYELSGRWDEAARLTAQALGLLEGKQLPEAAYRWEWQLGRIYRQQGRAVADVGARTQAVSAYQQAIASLTAVRQNLLAIDPLVQFSFRDNVEPLYREYVAILLEQQIASEPQTASEQNIALEQPALSDRAILKSAVKTLDALQLSELENFLGCNLSQLVNISEVGIDPQAAKIYPIVLPEQLAIILDIPGQPLALRAVPVARAEVEGALRDLRKNLTLPGKTPAVLAGASQLYDWLIAPLEPVLAENEQIETLVFVPDGPLRNIPMGVLYDGERYLVEKKYAIAIAPQLDLFAPRAAPQQLQVLRGGIGLPQTLRGQRFPTIELIQAELEQIPEALTVAPPLLDEAFTQANIEQQLASQQYSAIHWKTHGVFSSDPAETFLVAYGEGISANELSALVQSARTQQTEPLELLVLSACATAQGDRRAVLGLAGIAIRAGTRSAVSALWRADDGANTQLMDYFYQGLSENLTKAQALQKAQRALLSEAGYPAPYYWAPYVLVGNWL